MIKDLLGSWYIQFSDFPMWIKGDKKDPTFTYTLTNQEDIIDDTVSYTKNGKNKTVKGFDKKINNNEFIWQGYGLLRLFKSKWKVSYISEDKHIVIIEFEKSLVTPKGYDIISRSKNLNDNDSKNIIEVFNRLYPNISLNRISSDK